MILALLLMATHPQILTQSFPLQQFTLLHDMLPTTVDSLHQASSPFDLGYLNVAIPNMINSIKFGQLKLTLLSTNLPHAHFKREDSLILASPTSGHIATSTTPQFTPTCTPPLVCSKQQQTLDHWTIHRPFHTGISPKDSHTLVPQPKGPRDIFTDHLLPYGTTIKPVNKTNTLRICFQNTQFAFQLYNGDIEIQQIIRNLVNLEVGIFVPISPNVNWENNSNWVRIKQLFTGVSRPVHLTAMSSTIGKNPHYFQKSLVGGSAILTFGLWSSKVINSFSDPSRNGTYTVTTIQGKHNSKVSFITAYIAVNKGLDIGIDSLYAQQITLNERACKNPNTLPTPNHCQQKETIIHLDSLISTLQQQNHAIILMMDANQALHECFVNGSVRSHSIEWLRL